MTKKNYLIGEIFGNLTVLGIDSSSPRGKGNQIKYICQCSCENKTILSVKSNALRSGKKDNCGCLTRIKQSLAKKKYNKYDLSGKYGIGYTNKNEPFYFDLEDYDLIKDYCWNIHKSDRISYVESKDVVTRNVIKMHRLILGVENSCQIVDHISRKTEDNRKVNLRIVTNNENAKNHGESKVNKSGICGVSYRSDTNKWRSRITVNKKEINIGHFDSFEDAYIARMNAEKEYYGDYGRNDWNEKINSFDSFVNA